tara:strand:- start:2571 stop:3431 length:861 start_codon:yes stop_codon:yes gene_type:complete
MKRVLVTGGLGFIGSNLVDILKENYTCEVIVLDNLISDSSSQEYMRNDVEYWIDDIRNLNNGKYDREVDTIFHLAALARIQPSFEKPLETINVDSYGTAEVCEYARRNGSKVVYAGSSSFYGGPYLNPYAFAKWQGEEMCQLYSKCFGVNTAIARFFNVYGVRQPESGPYATVVGIFEKLYREGKPLTITGDGEQRRDFTHVNDICNGLIQISKGDWSGEIFNLGTSTNHSINELAALFAGSQTAYIPARPGEARNTLADISETTKKTDWKPNYKLEDYILSTTNK